MPAFKAEIYSEPSSEGLSSLWPPWPPSGQPEGVQMVDAGSSRMSSGSVSVAVKRKMERTRAEIMSFSLVEDASTHSQACSSIDDGQCQQKSFRLDRLDDYREEPRSSVWPDDH